MCCQHRADFFARVCFALADSFLSWFLCLCPFFGLKNGVFGRICHCSRDERNFDDLCFSTEKNIFMSDFSEKETRLGSFW